MNFQLGVWYSNRALSVEEAADMYNMLFERELRPTEQFPNVYAFYNELTSRYPDIADLSEDDIELSPWSCSHERSGAHVLVGLMADKAAQVAAEVLELAQKHGLVCFDPKNQVVHLPNYLQAGIPALGSTRGTNQLVSA